jgi:predicted nucleic acid-binding protein
VIVVSDTSPISELAKVGRLTILFDIYGRIFVPQEVYSEVISGTHPAVAAVQAAHWILVHPVTAAEKVATIRATTGLGPGECAAIVLAGELEADRLLIDDRAARREARARGLPLIGTVGTIVLAKQQGFISDVHEVLDELIACGMRISQQLYRDALDTAGE